MTKYEYVVTGERFISLAEESVIIDDKEFIEVISFGGDNPTLKLKSDLNLLDRDAVMPR